MGRVADKENGQDRGISAPEASSRWRSPLVVAVLAAGAAGLSNAGVTYLNGRNERALESSKAETTLILEMIKTGGNPDRAAENLRFLVDAGLVSEPDRVAQIRRYLVSRAPGTGVTLPTGSDRVHIQGSAELGESVKTNLKSNLAAYSQYLNSIGFQDAEQIKVEVDENIEANAYYHLEEKRLIISSKIITDKHVPLYTYTQHVLHQGKEKLDSSLGYQQLNTALADYYSSSFLDSPLVGQDVAKVLMSGAAALRNLDNNMTFADMKMCESIAAGEIWGGAFWEMRRKLGKASVDKLLSVTWRTTPPTDGRSGFAQAFVDNLRLKARETLLAEEARAVHETLRSRRLLNVAVLKSYPCA